MTLKTAKTLGLMASIISIVSPLIITIVQGAVLLQFINFILSFGSNLNSGGALNLEPFLSTFTLFQYVTFGFAGLSMIGYVLFMVAMYLLAQHYNTPKIFRNLLNVLLIQITAGVATIAVAIICLLATLGSFTSAGSTGVPSFVMSFLFIILAVVVVWYALSIYCGLLYKRSFDSLAEKTGVDRFKTAGLIYLVGIILPLPFVIWIAWVFAAIGYHDISTDQPSDAVYQSPQDTKTTKRCSHCDAENLLDSSYCCVCGRQIQSQMDLTAESFDIKP
ncbi:MAG: DUF996 domain-containing protein [Nitrososphaerota archaeon]|jgi:uncharacterized membrane protein|nr:DUF996 domain-containing protein [Nitrososphaerota archaeon]